MREKKNLDQNQNHSENEQRNDFPAGEPGQIMPEEKEPETNRSDNAGPRHTGNFKFQIRAENSSQQQ